jgi:hypothetical protein
LPMMVVQTSLIARVRPRKALKFLPNSIDFKIEQVAD